MTWHITTFYRFFQVSDPKDLRADLLDAMKSRQMVGLIIVAAEGINGTIAGTPEAIVSFKEWLTTEVVTEVGFKDSESSNKPFKKISVILRPEIVSLKRPDIVPREGENHYLNPSEWDALLKAQNAPLVIDTRNRYETKIGTFRGAIDPEIDAFAEWPKYVESLDHDRKEPVLIFCTGGIRCEKAALVMEAAGFQKVYQLRDGILGYLAAFPDGQFEGECFVFDERVAVDQFLRPSERYGLCSRCGDPTEDSYACAVCGLTRPLCSGCQTHGCKGCASRARQPSKSA